MFEMAIVRIDSEIDFNVIRGKISGEIVGMEFN